MKPLEQVKRHVEAIKTGLEALRKPPMTLMYPDVYEELENYRGIVTYDMEKCVGCSLCAQICPARAIKMYKLPGLRTPRPGIDLTRCIFCGFCVDICPTGALKHSNVVDVSFEKLEDAVLTPIRWSRFKPRGYAESRGAKPVKTVIDEEAGLRYEPVK